MSNNLLKFNKMYKMSISWNIPCLYIILKVMFKTKYCTFQTNLYLLFTNTVIYLTNSIKNKNKIV